MESDHTIVQDAETLFLAGNFRKSLMLCNKILKNSKPPVRNSDRQGATMKIPLETGLQLSFDASQKNRKMVLEIDMSIITRCNSDKEYVDDDIDDKKRISLVDRAATVALQSWYEISCNLNRNSSNSKETDTKKKKSGAQGQIHLLPFLDAYLPETANPHPKSSKTTHHNQRTNGLPMPIELAVIFVYFLRTTGEQHIHDAVELGSEIIWRTAVAVSRNQSSNFPRYVKYACQELASLLFLEILPYCSSQETIEKILYRFSTEKQTWRPVAWRLKTEEETNNDTLQKLISFLKKPPKSWTKHSLLDENFLRNCRSSLRRLLKLRELQTHDQTSLPTQRIDDGTEIKADGRQVDVNRTSTTTAATNAAEAIQQGTLTPQSPSERFLRSLLQLVQRKDNILQKLKDNKTGIVWALLMLLIAWRRRKGLVKVSGAAVRLFLAPFREVVDAIMKPT